MLVGTVVAANDTQFTDGNRRVAQQVDARILVELLGLRLAAVVFVIAQTGVDGSFQPAKLLMHPLVAQGTHGAVDDVAGNEHQVRCLGVHHVHPPVQLVALVVVA